MQDVINESILGMINDGTMSIERVNNLVYIKSFIDRIATKKYIEEDAAADLERKYGVRPDIVTWGDYFQSEMATSLMVVTDEEFNRAVETLKFDMVASWVIFCEKKNDFFEWVDNTHAAITGCKDSGFTEEEEEILHLKILKDYYTDLGLVNNFTEAEMQWFTGFQEAKVV
ncbi:MAG: hypothetical protein QUS13_07035 [Smithella sp.]|nr:hypothetical protein [Smithella sp.]